MIVKLFDKTEIIVSAEEAKSLERSMERDRDGVVKIKGYVIKKTAIAYIRPGGVTLADIPKIKPMEHNLLEETDGVKQRSMERINETIERSREKLIARGIPIKKGLKDENHN